MIMSNLDKLKKQADELGISYSANISETTLQKRIDEQTSTANEENKTKTTSSKELTENEKIKQLKDNALKLVKVIVTPMESTKKNHQGEIFTVSNDYVSASKYVLFNEEWFVEDIIVKELEQKQTQVFQTRKNDKGVEIVTPKIIKAYSVNRLPLPTPEELAELAKSQAARQAIDTD